jgi:thymidylate kinase
MVAPAFDAVWINGSVGAGKTTTADRLGKELEIRGIPGAVIDVDWLRRCWPAPPEDIFQAGLAAENIRAVAKNFRAGGAQVIVVAGVLEDPAEVARAGVALGADHMLLVRLTLHRAVALSRIRRRHGGDHADMEWHANRHPELALILEHAGFANELVIDTTFITPDQVAQDIADRLTTNLR